MADFGTTLAGFATAYGTTNQFKVKVTADLSTFGQSIASAYTSERSAIKIPVQADMSKFGESIVTIYTSSRSAVKIPVEADTTTFGESLMNLDDNFHVTVTTEGISEASMAAGNLIVTFGALAKTWTATIAQTGAAETGAYVQSVIDVATAMAVTWTATIAQSGALGVLLAVGSVKLALESIVKTYTATVTVQVNRGELNMLLNSLANLPTSKTITLTTVNETVNVTRGGGTATPNGLTGGMIGSAAMLGRAHDPSAIVPRAAGGMIGAGEYTLVGELGPELVKLPTGSWVHTARQTSRMFRNQQALQRRFSAHRSPYTAPPTSLGSASYSPPSFGRNESNLGSSTTSGGAGTTNNFHFHGDVVIGDKKAGEDFFAEIDRRAGRRTSLATRGMYPTDDTRPWT